jgi:hypothetical protein
LGRLLVLDGLQRVDNAGEVGVDLPVVVDQPRVAGVFGDLE